MDFSFSSDQQDLRELAAKILSDATTLERTKQVVADSDGFDRDLWAALADAGIIGISLPESVGGAGLGYLETCIVLEEVGRTAAPIPALAVMALAAPALVEFGATDALDGVAAGTSIVTAALTEAVGDVHAPTTTASGGKLNGEKVCVPAGLDAKAIVVSAADGLYLVDPSASGVTVEREDTCSARRPPAWCCATPRPPSWPAPRVWPGCSSGRTPRSASPCRGSPTRRSTSPRRT